MIRYATLPGGAPITQKTLESALKAEADGHEDPEIRKVLRDWSKKARARTKQLLTAGKYIDADQWHRLPAAERNALDKPIDVDWSSVKYLFMRIQNEKCAYCERKLASEDTKGGRAEHDVEHFRPKNSIKRWPAPNGIDFPTGDPDEGYYWLAFHLLNYCTACATCNRGFKSSYFPVAGKRLLPQQSPISKAASAERPLLIYPLGKVDEDPEELIRFRGIAAVPPADDPLLDSEAKTDPHRNRRARVTIRFFGLNEREELRWGRAEKLRELEKSLSLIHKGNRAENKAARDDLLRLTNGSSEHTACVRAMIRLYDNNKKTAQLYFEGVRDYLNSKTPSPTAESAGRLVRASSSA
jgi:hypothetical protein